MTKQEIEATLVAFQSDENTMETTFIVIQGLDDDTQAENLGSEDQAPEVKSEVPSENAPKQPTKEKEIPIPRKTRSKVAGVKPKPTALKMTTHRRATDKKTTAEEGELRHSPDKSSKNSNFTSHKMQVTPQILSSTGTACSMPKIQKKSKEKTPLLYGIMRREPKSYMMTKNLHPEYCQSPRLKPT